MPRNQKWNKDIYRKLENLKKMDQKELVHTVQTNTNEYGETIKSIMPELYGGFKTSVYYETRLTETGVVGVIGIDNDKHVDLNPKGIHSDDFTNKELANWLLNKPNKSQWKMQEIQEWMKDYQNTTRDAIRDYWNSKVKRR